MSHQLSGTQDTHLRKQEFHTLLYLESPATQYLATIPHIYNLAVFGTRMKKEMKFNLKRQTLKGLWGIPRATRRGWLGLGLSSSGPKVTCPQQKVRQGPKLGTGRFEEPGQTGQEQCLHPARVQRPLSDRTPHGPGLGVECVWLLAALKPMVPLQSPSPSLHAAAWAQPVYGRGGGWSHSGRRPLPLPPVKLRPGPCQPVSGPLAQHDPTYSPSPLPRNNIHDSSSAFCRWALLSTKAFTSAKPPPPRQGLPALRMHKRSSRHGSEAARLAPAIRTQGESRSFQAQRRTLS